MKLIDEAIKHAENVALNSENGLYDAIALGGQNPSQEEIDECMKCAEEHRQLAEWLKELKRYQSVDAVEVVRCKDCKYAHMTYGGECKYCDMWKEDGEALYLDGDFFCAYGERKEP